MYKVLSHAPAEGALHQATSLVQIYSPCFQSGRVSCLGQAFLLVLAKAQRNQPNHASVFQVSAPMTSAHILWAKASHVVEPKVNERVVNGRHCTLHGKGYR